MPVNPRAVVETYFADLRRVHASGGATGELSIYGPLSTLLNTVGGMLKPKVFCIGQLSDQGAGHPDFGLYVANQVRSGRRRPGQIPERGVVEVKGVEDDARITSDSDQVRRYLGRYQLVLGGCPRTRKIIVFENLTLYKSVVYKQDFLKIGYSRTAS